MEVRARREVQRCVAAAYACGARAVADAPVALCIVPVGADAPQIYRIYNYYVLESVATFEEDVVSKHDMAQRIERVLARLPWLVWEASGEIVGYPHATPWKSRAAYRHTVETTIYLEKSVTGRGIGTQLYRALIDELRRRNVHCALAGIALPNPASIALHERLGFTKVGQLRDVGYRFGQ